MPTSPANRIAQKPLPGRLLADGVARRLESPTDWQGGITFNEDCGCDGGTYGCTDTPPEKERDGVGAVVEFQPFLVYHERECSTSTPADVTEQDARDGLERLRSMYFARELHSSGANTLNPDLVGSGVDITPVTPASLSNTLQGLLGQYHSLGVSEALLHAPFWTLPEWLKIDGFAWTGGRYQYGHIPVSFDAYPNIGPEATPDENDGDAPAPGDGEAWIWITGPVEWNTATVEVFSSVTEPGAGARQNIRISMAEQLAILRFDPCSVLAAKAKVC